MPRFCSAFATTGVANQQLTLQIKKLGLREIAEAIKAAYGAGPDQAPALYRRHSTLANQERLTMPVYLSHGGADAIIPVEQARRLAEGMRGRNNFAYDEVPGGNHDAPLHDTKGLGWVMGRMV